MASSFVHELPPYVRREPREGTRGAPALDGEGMARTETADRSVLAAAAATQLAPRQHTVYFSRRVWTRGVTQAAGAGALFSIAVFLLFQIPSTPALRNDLALMGILGCTFAAVLAVHALRNMIGRLTVDERGLRLEPAIAGFDTPWTELRRWYIPNDCTRLVTRDALRICSRNSVFSRTVSCDQLGTDDLEALRELLRKYAPNREYVPSTPRHG